MLLAWLDEGVAWASIGSSVVVVAGVIYAALQYHGQSEAQREARLASVSSPFFARLVPAVRRMESAAGTLNALADRWAFGYEGSPQDEQFVLPTAQVRDEVERALGVLDEMTVPLAILRERTRIDRLRTVLGEISDGAKCGWRATISRAGQRENRPGSNLSSWTSCGLTLLR